MLFFCSVYIVKFENVLFVNDTPRAEIKLIDFGLSKTYVGGQTLTEGVGTVSCYWAAALRCDAMRCILLLYALAHPCCNSSQIYTMAPEVLMGTYTSQADLWSIGVIAYMLLSSNMPFYGRKRCVLYGFLQRYHGFPPD